MGFKGYIDSEGKSKARQYRGYTDPRLNRLYVHLIQSELRQCYERIRPDSSDDPKFVYLDTAFPCTDYLTDLVDRKVQMVRTTAERIFDSMLQDTLLVYRSKFTMQLRAESGCSEAVANKLYDDIIKGRTDVRIHSVEKFVAKIEV